MKVKENLFVNFVVKNFLQREGMSCHIKTIHEGIRYQCDLCEKSFSQLPNLKAHAKCHKI